jgi:hypothetical protein
MESTLQHVVTRIATHGADFLAVTLDSELNAALGPFRQDPPRRVCCPKCGRGLAYIAIDPQRPAVVGKRVGARSERLFKGQPGSRFFYRRARIMRAKPESPEAITAGPPLYQRWQLDGQTIGEAADAHLPPEHRLRWVISCQRFRCGRTYLATNTGLLMLLVQAHARGEDDIVLPPSCRLSADWKPYLRPDYL